MMHRGALNVCVSIAACVSILLVCVEGGGGAVEVKRARWCFATPSIGRHGAKPPPAGLIVPGSINSCHRTDGARRMRASRHYTSNEPEMKTCVLCGRVIPARLESKHHLVPKLKGGKSVEENLVLMHRCLSFHVMRMGDVCAMVDARA
jgi:hypothetical protein